MRVLHVVAGVERGGGIGESVPRLCAALVEEGLSVVLATLEQNLSGPVWQAEQTGVQLELMKPSAPSALFFSVEMMLRLPTLVRAAGVVHVHSNWTFPVWWGCLLALAYGKPLVMSPRGCLDPVRLRHSVWKKRLVGWLDRHFLRRAEVIHATSDIEARWIELFVFRNGIKKQSISCNLNPVSTKPKIVIVPDGVNVEAFSRQTVNAQRGDGIEEVGLRTEDDSGNRGKRTLLYLGRLHPLKGLDLLISAWNRAVSNFPEWRLLIIGNDEQGVLKRLEDQVGQLGLEGCVTVCKPLYNDERVRAMRNADLFVLPTRSENFGIVVAEALACGVPVITTKGAPWSELLGNSDNSLVHNCDSALVDSNVVDAKVPNGKGATAELCTKALTNSRTNELATSGRCGWWVDVGVEPLAEALLEAMSLTDTERREMGQNGRRLVEAKYHWAGIAERMAGVYEALLKEAK
jgi:glycosyltransferase involved in cell wall biosynthesis